MSKEQQYRKTSKENEMNPVFLNAWAVIFMYLVIIIFSLKQLSISKGTTPNTDLFESYANIFVGAVGISTFTYVFPLALQNAISQENSHHIREQGMWILLFDILYIIIYILFIPRPFLLNLFLSGFTVVLIGWASYLVHQAYKYQENGQAEKHNMVSEVPVSSPSNAAAQGKGENVI